jgi:hypothetical protein
MALNSKSLFNYGIQVTNLNQNIDFRKELGGNILTAQLNLGFYSPGGLADQVALQLQSIDPENVYTVTVDRTILGGTQNRITIATSGSFLELLFATGPNENISAAGILGFNAIDYTGSTSYTGAQTTGTILIPDYIGYNYSDSDMASKLFGAVNVAASGLKEAVTFNTQFFVEVEFKYEPASRLSEWKSFFIWAIQQRQFDFTPQLSNPSLVYNSTLEKTEYDDQGLGYKMRELLGESLPNFYTTGPLVFRIIPSTAQFITG